MEQGRVPVIISDDWLPNPDIDWGSFSIRIAEKDVPRISEILEPYLPRMVEMEKAARVTWENISR
jgi:hypothetical protein